MALRTIYKNQSLTFINKQGINIYLAIVIYWLNNLAMARYLKNSLNIN